MKETLKLRVTGLCDSPHKCRVTRKSFHLMTSSWNKVINDSWSVYWHSERWFSVRSVRIPLFLLLLLVQIYKYISIQVLSRSIISVIQILVILSHASLGIWLFIHAWSKVGPVRKEGAWNVWMGTLCKDRHRGNMRLTLNSFRRALLSEPYIHYAFV